MSVRGVVLSTMRDTLRYANASQNNMQRLLTVSDSHLRHLKPFQLVLKEIDHRSHACRVQASVEDWRQYNRYLRYQKASKTKGVKVSWDRYHLSVLFIDRYVPQLQGRGKFRTPQSTCDIKKGLPASVFLRRMTVRLWLSCSVSRCSFAAQIQYVQELQLGCLTE